MASFTPTTSDRVRPLGGQRLGRRTRQEDAWAVGVSGASGVWGLIADGMGGHAHGDQAAKAAVAAMIPYVTQNPEPHDRWVPWLLRGIEAADSAVRRITPAAGRPPGTTLLAAVGQYDHVWIAHVGDSRAYLLHGNHLQPQTTDMTPAGERFEAGQATWEEQNTARDSHILTACLGCGPVAVDCFAVRWEPGDLLVLTTDGLNPLPLNAWPALLRSPRPVEAVLEAQAWSDNATVAILPHPLSKAGESRDDER